MTHRVLVVGVGSIGERHVRCFAATGRARVILPSAALISWQFAYRSTIWMTAGTHLPPKFFSMTISSQANLWYTSMAALAICRGDALQPSTCST